MRITPFTAALLALAAMLPAQQVQSYKDRMGQVSVGPVKYSPNSPLEMGFIIWGGDVITHHANGGLTTAKDSIWGQLGLNIRLVPGDDAFEQARRYMSGQTPFFRGTAAMCLLFSEVFNSDPRTKGVSLYQKTWSTGGDNLAVRSGIRTLTDIKGKKIAIQEGGPHLKLLWDILRSAGLSFGDIEVIWCKNLTGDDSPADRFRKDSEIAGCFVITPDLLALCGGYDTTGSGAEGTVSGARRLTGTHELRRSIADVILVRKDFYDAHPEVCYAIVNGLLRATEEFINLSKVNNGTDQRFIQVLERSRKIWGEELFPTLDDIRGLATEDCSFVGYPGNVKFFTEKGNLTGFEAHQNAALEMALALGIVKTKTGFFPSGLDYSSSKLTAGLTATEVKREGAFRAEAVAEEIESLATGELDERTLLSFTISFESNQDEFTELVYGQEFQRVVELATRFKGAVLTVRGHSDPAKALLNTIKAGMSKGAITRSGSKGNYTYYLNGQQLDISQTEKILNLIAEGALEPGPGEGFESPQETVRAALNLSKQRANEVTRAVMEYAKAHGLELDETQFTNQGVGIAEPVIAVPRDMADAKKNMRVEFRLVRVSAEVMTESDFDF